MNHRSADPVKPGCRVMILTYHQIGEFARPARHKGQYCHIDRFRAQMAYLARSRFTVVSLQAAYEGLFAGGPLPRRAVVLTFDDGYCNFRDFAWPVLQAHGFPASLFVVAGAIGGRADWLAGDAAATPLLDTPALRELAEAGVTIGSHAFTHCRLGMLPPARSRAEVFDSKARLEDILGMAVPHFCYPYGHYDQAARDAVCEAGYLSALTCIRSRADLAANAYEIPRQAISYKDTRLHYGYKLGLKHARKTARAPAIC